MNGEEFAEELYREHLYFLYEDKCNELSKELENLKKIEKEHQRINGKLREENKQLKHQLQQKENIIKEIRENINKKLNVNSDYVDYDFGIELLRQEFLEILDKVEE